MSTQTSEHASESTVAAPSNPRRAAQKAIATLVQARKASGQNPVIEPTAKSTKPASRTAARRSQLQRAEKAPTKKPTTVTVRRVGKPAGDAKQGQYVIILDPRVFGSTGKNWLGRRTFDTRELALAAAAKAGAKVAE